MSRLISTLMAFSVTVFAAPAMSRDLVHDAEYYILAQQNGEKWAQEDKALQARLAEFREKNGGKPPNIFYILIDDIGFGDLGSKTLNMIRGYETPHINKIDLLLCAPKQDKNANDNGKKTQMPRSPPDTGQFPLSFEEHDNGLWKDKEQEWNLSTPR